MLRAAVTFAALTTTLALAGWSGPSRSAAVTAGRIIFQDDFSNPKSGWNTSSDAQSSVGYQGGAYFIKIKKPGLTDSYANLAPAPRDVLVEVVARNVTGRSDTAFGVACRNSKTGGYQFGIYDDGTYTLRRSKGLRSVPMKEGGSALIPVRAALYRIGASCVGDRLSLFVNGKKIASVKDDTYASGWYGLWAAASGPREIRFTKFVVRAA